MPITLSVPAVERSTYAIIASFTDANGSPVTPSALTWKLTDALGNVVNNRAAVNLSPAESVTIVLSGDDLALTYFGNDRYVTVEGTYNSSLGSDLPLKEQVKFTIVDLVAVT